MKNQSIQPVAFRGKGGRRSEKKIQFGLIYHTIEFRTKKSEKMWKADLRSPQLVLVFSRDRMTHGSKPFGWIAVGFGSDGRGAQRMNPEF